MLNLLEAYDLKALGPQSAEALHLMIEAKKLAYEDRAKYYADPDFGPLPVSTLISKPYAARRRSEIKPDRANLHPRPGDPAQAATIYLTVVDRDFNCVSLIQSNFHGFGSHHVPAGLGFVLQNRGCLFALDPAHLNRLEPRKRPFHTIIPGFVTKDGKPWLSFGLMGGDMQAQGHAQVICNMIDFGMDVQEAGDAPQVSAFRLIRADRPAGEGGRLGRTRVGYLGCSQAGPRSERPPARQGPGLLRRLPGDPDRPGTGRADRRLGPAQGRVCEGGGTDLHELHWTKSNHHAVPRLVASSPAARCDGPEPLEPRSLLDGSVPPGMDLAQANWFYQNTFAAPADVAPEWNGNVATGDAGSLGEAYLAAIIARVNDYRWMAGLPGGVTLDPTENAEAQQAALMMAANDRAQLTLRPQPGSTTRPPVRTARRIPTWTWGSPGSLRSIFT